MKKSVVLILVFALVVSLTACGKADGSYESKLYGTWNAVSVIAEGSTFTLSELAAMGQEPIHNFCFVIKEGGKAYINDDGEGELVDWSTASDGINLGKYTCAFIGDLLCIQINDTKINFAKTSDSQDITNITAEVDENSAESMPKDSTLLREERENRIVEFQGYQFQIPYYFDVLDENSTEAYRHFYPEQKDYYCSLGFSTVGTFDISEQKFESIRSELADKCLNEMKENSETPIEEIESVPVTVAEKPAWMKSFYSKNEREELVGTGIITVAFNINTKCIVVISIVWDTKDQSNYDYQSDYKKIIESAVLLPSDEDATDELIDGMRPEFKEAMDSYEDFYDDYCDFVKQYSKNPADLKMLAEYSNMVTKLADMNEKFEAWGDDDLNDAELRYYLEVNNRISQKLLEAAQ